MTNKINTKIDLPRLIIKIVEKVVREVRKAIITKPEDKEHGKENPH